ncbi:hypothetical protein ABZ467_37635 [Streptomyces sp. NPDC005727]|uniref:hypothetical protein n=1 Tax=Streptomyces sp. NPDC005727 TaxID=3157053 RepID=UPI0033F6F12C
MISQNMRSAIHEALSMRDGDDLIRGVKTVLIDELSSLDPAMEIENTGYFNHTYVPDLVLSWGEGNRKQTRDVFLRFSLRAAALGRDVQALAQGAPVLLALREDADEEEVSSVQRDVEAASDVLVTGVPALDEIKNPARPRSLQYYGVGSRGEESPLLDLVRSSVMRGGRGLLTTEAAHDLRSRTQVEDRETEVDELRNFGQSIREIFGGETAVRLERAAQIMQIGLTGEVGALEENFLADPEDDEVIRGRLSESELRVMLPYLLKREDITDDPRYWRHLGRMLSLDALERISADLQGLNLSRLVEPNKETWLALKSALAYNVEPPGHERGGDPRWEFRARVLNLILGEYRVMVTADRRRIKTREGNAPARWDDIADDLSAFHLTGVTLEGLNRRVQVNGENDGDVYRDVRAITESIHDEFHVPRVEVAASVHEGAPRISVDFESWAATADNGVSLEIATAVAMKILGRGVFS